MDLLSLLEEVRTIAQNGLTYTENPYDIERYQKLLELTIQQYSEVLDIPSAEVRQKLAAELGYITPKIGVDCAIFDEQERILLVKRSDNGLYGLPGGAMDPNETPQQTAERETREETGYIARPLRLVDVYTERATTPLGLFTWVALVYLGEITGGEPTLSHETAAIGYWRIEDVPAWHGRHHEYALAAREAFKSV